jgi:hypothetical protein
MMQAAFRVLLSVAIALALSKALTAKGSTSRITISGGSLANPIEIKDANVVKEFQIWAGPGTRTCGGGRSNCADGTEGFIADWSSGAVADKPSGLPRYDVAFFVIDDRFPDRREPEQLAYVVSYEYDAARSQGYVYLPGRDDKWYQLNTRSIYRSKEGNWFRASRAWQDAVVSLIANR